MFNLCIFFNSYDKNNSQIELNNNLEIFKHSVKIRRSFDSINNHMVKLIFANNYII